MDFYYSREVIDSQLISGRSSWGGKIVDRLVERSYRDFINLLIGITLVKKEAKLGPCSCAKSLKSSKNIFQLVGQVKTVSPRSMVQENSTNFYNLNNRSRVCLSNIIYFNRCTRVVSTFTFPWERTSLGLKKLRDLCVLCQSCGSE